MQAARDLPVQHSQEAKMQLDEEKGVPGGYRPIPSGHLPRVTVQYKPDPSRTMLACQWVGAEEVRVERVPAPDVTDPADVIVRNTAVTICGSDLHLSAAKCTRPPSPLL